MSSQTPSSPSTSVVTDRREPALAPLRPSGALPGSRALQRAGGPAALVTAGTYLVGLVVLYGWYLVLYPVGWVALMSVVLALHTRFRNTARALAATGAVLGPGGLLIAGGMVHLVGQQAVVALTASDPESASTVWASVRVVRDALGGGIEVVGAVWVLLVGAGVSLLGDGARE